MFDYRYLFYISNKIYLFALQNLTTKTGKCSKPRHYNLLLYLHVITKDGKPVNTIAYFCSDI